MLGFPFIKKKKFPLLDLGCLHLVSFFHDVASTHQPHTLTHELVVLGSKPCRSVVSSPLRDNCVDYDILYLLIMLSVWLTYGFIWIILWGGATGR